MALERFELVREIHRRDVTILGARFDRRKWREGTGAAQDFERLAIEHVVVCSVLGRYCCKSRKSSDPENLAKVDLWTSLPLRRFSTPLRRSVIDFG